MCPTGAWLNVRFFPDPKSRQLGSPDDSSGGVVLTRHPLAEKRRDQMTQYQKPLADSNPEKDCQRDPNHRGYKPPALAKVEKLAQVTGMIQVTGPTDGLGKIA